MPRPKLWHSDPADDREGRSAVSIQTERVRDGCVLEDLASSGTTWLSVDEPSAPAWGWYAVLRLHREFAGRLICGAAYCGEERWGRNHDIFARSCQAFADADSAEAFATMNSKAFGNVFRTQ